MITSISPDLSRNRLLWFRRWMALMLICHWAGAGFALASEPAVYTRKANWLESLIASLEALPSNAGENGVDPFESGTMCGGDPAQQVSVPLGSATELYLFVTGVPDTKWAVADWADARLVRADGSSVPLTAASNYVAVLGRCEKDITLKSGLYQKLGLRGKTFDRGLNVQADSIVRVLLDEKFARFEATIGMDDWAGTNGSVRFSVLGGRRAAARQLWVPLMRDFGAGPERQQMNWEREDRIFEFDWVAGEWAALAQRYAAASDRVPPLAHQSREMASRVTDLKSLQQLRDGFYLRSRALAEAHARASSFDFEALRSAVEDLASTFPGKFPRDHVAQVASFQRELQGMLAGFQPVRLESWTALEHALTNLERFQREALLANPLLNFDSLLVLKRVPLGGARRTSWEGFGYGEYLGIPRQSSWNYGTMPNVDTWTNDISLLSPVRPDGALKTVYRPPGTQLINDLELNWDADRLLFSMPDTNRNWQVHELKLSDSKQVPGTPRQLTPVGHKDVHNYDGIYLPSGDIIFLSTAPLQGVPCNAGVIVGMMYKMGANGESIRQLTFEQDHDYTPSVLNNGRVLYLRWDYTDTPHVWNRLLMSMNPDGTAQMEYTGANSYWPNAMFFARAIPNHPTKIVTIATGHHEGRVGELFIFDPAKGRSETDGVVQRIPKKGPPVLPKIEDKLTEHSWPKFLHPWPLSEKYFLVACKPAPDALWGIYLVDVFDNMTLLREEEGAALLEPVPLHARARPPVIVDRVQASRTNALVYMEDVYSGPGLRGVPRGTVKALRLFTYHFGYQRLAGIDHRVGADGPWEAKRVLGTVPVESDGSALFDVPAKTPISFQPLDKDGKAVALMRSWMSAQPGENVSCVGCHDRQSSAPPGANLRIALTKPANQITPWRGPARGFSFVREVQPVLDRYCVGCHDGTKSGVPDLRRDQGGYVVYRAGELDGQLVRKQKQELLGKYGAVFEPSYVALRQYVRVGGLESDLHLLPPREFGADTSELIQMLTKGHHNVHLDSDAWDRLITWIDLNAPCHGTWAETTKIPGNQVQRRLELRQLYAGLVENCEAVPDEEPSSTLPQPIMPEPEASLGGSVPSAAGWPFNTSRAQALQAEAGPVSRMVDLGGGVMMELVRIPAGSFVMGDPGGAPDERARQVVRVNEPFWMGKCEVSNEQFAQFDPTHDSRFEHRSSWWFDQEYTGWPLNRPRQPVVRVSWEEAKAFCRWLSDKLGQAVTLPSEEQWEWACRAGTASAFSYGELDADFSTYANMGDTNLRRLADEGWRPKAPDLVAKDSRFDDGALVTAEIGHYRPNAWGLHDMHGNVAEWTRSVEVTAMGRNGKAAKAGEAQKKVVRGGSWRDRPKLCRSSSRWAYDPWQKVYNVGFRVIIQTNEARMATAQERPDGPGKVSVPRARVGALFQP